MNRQITMYGDSMDTGIGLVEPTQSSPLDTLPYPAPDRGDRAPRRDDSPMSSVSIETNYEPTDEALLAATRAGDERAFERLVSRHHPSMVRTAKRYVRETAAAEDVAQEAWLGFLDSLSRFENRCSVRTWLFRILVNKAKTRGAADAKFVALSAMAAETDGTESMLDPTAVLGSNEFTGSSCDANQPSWKSDPEQILLDKEVHDLVRRTIADLPTACGDVIDMRDVQGFSAREVCQVLDLSEVHQRVLLHRARSRVRAVLAEYLS